MCILRNDQHNRLYLQQFCVPTAPNVQNSTFSGWSPFLGNLRPYCLYCILSRQRKPSTFTSQFISSNTVQAKFTLPHHPSLIIVISILPLIDRVCLNHAIYPCKKERKKTEYQFAIHNDAINADFFTTSLTLIYNNTCCHSYIQF